MFYPKQSEIPKKRTTVQTFLGYQRRDRCADGAFSYMENLSSDYFPALSPRRPRGVLRALSNPLALAGKEKLAYVDGKRLYWDGQQVPGLVISTDEADQPKQLVSMGAYLIVFPDGVYFNTTDLSDSGTLEGRWQYSCTETQPIRYAPCLEDGTEFNRYYILPEAPARPEDGDIWCDTGAQPHAFRKYNAQEDRWETLGPIYTRVDLTASLQGLEAGDWVIFSGCDTDKEQTRDQVRKMNREFEILEMMSPTSIRVGGVILDDVSLQKSGSVFLRRKIPRLDYVTECGNRLWGCRYGTVNGKTVNEIYASALGDFKSWFRFRGLSTDSYAASRGSDGPWTGAFTYQNCPIFFKENCMEKVYPSASGAHQIVTVNCRGVQPGSSESLAVVNGILYYKASDGVCAYDGSIPEKVSSDLGQTVYSHACAGAMGDKYYLSAKDPEGESHVLAYDTRLGLWHREDSTDIRAFARVGSELYALDAAGWILSMGGAAGDREAAIHWMAETGVLGLDEPGHQVLSRMSLRFSLAKGSDLEVWTEYDSSGIWEYKAHVSGEGLRSLVIPILPTRCDHLRLRLRGRGDCRVFSLTLTREEGGDGA